MKKYNKILVTGADGYIGSHLVEKLVADGCDVRAFVLYNSFNSWGWLDAIPQSTKDKIEVVMGDVRDYHFVKHAMDGVDAVLHLAALIAIPYSYHAPQSYVETNVTGTLNIVQTARELGTKKVIHTSTSEVYGTAQFVPITEEHPLHGQSPYSASKIGADQMAISYHRSFETPVAIVRPFNTYGPRQSTRAVIPTVITQIAAGQTDIQLGALTPTRDFSFVDDTVSGFITAMNNDAIIGQVTNIGSGFEISIGDTVDLIADIMGVDINVICDENRMRPEASEVNRLFADIKKAKDVMNWEPSYGGLDGFRRGMEKTVKWFSNPENLKHYKVGEYTI